jgi:hypothetical protein
MEQSTRSLGGIVFGVVVGIGLGALGMSLFGSDTEPEISSSSLNDDAYSAERQASRRSVTPRADVTPRDKAAPPGGRDAKSPDDDSLISPFLLAFARSEIAAGWAEHRQDEIPEATVERGLGQFDEGVRALPRSLGKSLAEQATKDEVFDRALQTGDGVSFLAILGERGERPALEIIEDEELWNSFFTPMHDEVLLPTGRERLRQVEAGTTIELGAGVYDLSRFLNAWRGRQDIVDVRIRGAGMNATMIVLKSDVSPDRTVQRLKISDCTVNCNNNYFFDHRHPGTVMTVEGVRIVGFDMGAGGSCMMGCRQLMMDFRRCEILGGYSRAPVGFGDLFDVRSTGHLARFDDCTIRHVELGSHNRGTLFFRNCRLDQILDNPKSLTAERGKHFENCSISQFQRVNPETRESVSVRHDLNDLFPNWKDRIIKY